MAKNVVRAFKRDKLKDSRAVTEVVHLAPVLEKDDFQLLLREFYSGIDHSRLLDIHQLEGLAQLIQGSGTGYIETDDYVKILTLLSTRLQNTHHQSPAQLYKLTLALSHVLDAMADAGVKDLDRVTLHEPLSSFLGKLKASKDSYLVYQAAYAFQALLYIPNNESLGKAIQDVSGLVSAVKGLDHNVFMEALKDIQNGLAGASQIIKVGKTVYDGVKYLKESGQGFMESLKEGLGFSHRSAWYPALREADTLIRDGQFAKFRRLVCEAPCRRDHAFQRLRDVASNQVWDVETRRSSIAFLGEIYTDDGMWGHHVIVKQWILNILMQLPSMSLDAAQSVIDTTLQGLGKNGDDKKQALYRSCCEDGPGSHPLKVMLPEIGSPSLLDRVQERLDVEGTLRKLGKERLKERGNAVYIPPQAKASLSSQDGERFALIDTVEKSLKEDRKVFTDFITSITYSPKGDQLASANNYHTRLWDAETGACLHTLDCGGSIVYTAMYSPQGDLVSTAGSDNIV
ncbi:hypothetical protein BGX31_000493 [Mortierella sp. GBA43]|nr:hypothetical protein BGX31_000493 [Mortierella sp. GBA43]